MDNNDNNRPQGELLVYQGQGLESPVQVRLEGERWPRKFGQAVKWKICYHYRPDVVK